jgi:cyclophilin family peptidyl-prolyl cis-trans isomerase/FKBP-type peptidyl-prolyl cis-trans isomerase
MTRAFVIFRLLTLVVLLAACGGKDKPGGAASSTEAEESQLKGRPSPNAPRPAEPATVEQATADDGLYAVLHTSMGDVVCRLYFEKAPVTVANFVALAEGGQRWYDPQTKQWSTEPLYRDLKFHQVVKDLLVESGDPQGDGKGGPGYQFEDEFDRSLSHDGPGVVSMSNDGPNTNGSRFYITLGAADWLDNHDTMFGRVVKGQDVVDAMGEVDLTGPQHSTPEEDVLLESIDIVRRGAAADAFDPQAHLTEINTAIDERIAFAESIQGDLERATRTDSGLRYVILEKGEGAKPSPGDRIIAHYDAWYLDGTEFQSSRDKGIPFTALVGRGQMIKGWDEAIRDMREGETRRLIVPPELAYGEKGIPGHVRPNATLVFDVELLQVQPAEP